MSFSPSLGNEGEEGYGEEAMESEGEGEFEDDAPVDEASAFYFVGVVSF